jgi:hypothetical protein
MNSSLRCRKPRHGTNPQRGPLLALSCAPCLQMRITSFSDMLARVPYYKSILHVLSVLCRPECAPLLAQPMPADVEGGTSVAAVVAQLSIPATQYIKVCSIDSVSQSRFAAA